MFDREYDPYAKIEYLDTTVLKITEHLEEMSLLFANQSRHLEILTYNYRHQAHELGQQKMYIQLLDQRINQLENLK
jgi:hypothetical protein